MLDLGCRVAHLERRRRHRRPLAEEFLQDPRVAIIALALCADQLAKAGGDRLTLENGNLLDKGVPRGSCGKVGDLLLGTNDELRQGLLNRLGRRWVLGEGKKIHQVGRRYLAYWPAKQILNLNFEPSGIGSSKLLKFGTTTHMDYRGCGTHPG